MVTGGLQVFVIRKEEQQPWGKRWPVFSCVCLVPAGKSSGMKWFNRKNSWDSTQSSGFCDFLFLVYTLTKIRIKGYTHVPSWEPGFMLPGTAHTFPFFCGTVIQPTCCHPGMVCTLFREEFVCLTGDWFFQSKIISIFNTSKANLIEIWEKKN